MRVLAHASTPAHTHTHTHTHARARARARACTHSLRAPHSPYAPHNLHTPRGVQAPHSLRVPHYLPTPTPSASLCTTPTTNGTTTDLKARWRNHKSHPKLKKAVTKWRVGDHVTKFPHPEDYKRGYRGSRSSKGKEKLDCA